MNLLVKNITKHYQTPVLENISFEATKGVIGLIGENGAGKTTLIEIIATLTQATSGSILYEGLLASEHLYELRQQIGYLPQHFNFFPSLSVEECLAYSCRIKGITKKQRLDEINEKIAYVGLATHRKKKFSNLSGGMKQRLGIAQALLGNPKLLIVDEPTVGLDPKERVAFRQLLTNLGQDRLIILSTHIIEDIAMTCEKILLLHQGNLNYYGTIFDFIKHAEGKVWCYEGESLLPEITEQGSVIASRTTAQGIHVRFIANYKIASSQLVPPTLEDAYIYANQKQVAL